MTRLWDRFIDKAQLVSLPAVYLRLKAVIDDPNFSMADVATVVSQDPAMTARLLRQVNSAYYRYPGRQPAGHPSGARSGTGRIGYQDI
jgi:HD-like signal output (HDOD) protein